MTEPARERQRDAAFMSGALTVVVVALLAATVVLNAAQARLLAAVLAFCIGLIASFLTHEANRP